MRLRKEQQISSKRAGIECCESGSSSSNKEAKVLVGFRPFEQESLNCLRLVT